jgi:glucose/arabinose dehydrogenase
LLKHASGLALVIGLGFTVPAFAQNNGVYGDWRTDAPGAVHHIRPSDLPAPSPKESASNSPEIIKKPAAGTLHVPAGFAVTRLATGLSGPRIIRVAPNGDIFVAESSAGRILVIRPKGAMESRTEIFAHGLDQPFGIAFYPPGPDPQWVYVANNNTIQRFSYANGDLTARGPAQTIVAKLSDTSSHHWTRDVAFSEDGTRMFVSIGSGSNDAEDMPRQAPQAIANDEHRSGVGAAWGGEAGRADLLVFTPSGEQRQVYATGLRNCAGVAVQQKTNDVWCATNERDGLGNNLPPDYVTHVQNGGFYGWPWFYIGNHQDPRHVGERPDLAGRVDAPDVLIQPHSAPLGIAFYHAAGPAAFPSDYDGDAFVALHGSWNRANRTGYKVVRIHFHNGVTDGSYQDFLTGFVASDGAVWGRPVGVAEAADGALLVSDDGGGAIWRIAPTP